MIRSMLPWVVVVASAVAQGPPSRRDPALDQLEFLVGSWRAESGGQAVYRWAPGNVWLSYEFRADLPGLGPYELHGKISFDSTSGKYMAYVFNNLAPRMMEYRGSWTSDRTLVFDSASKGARGTLQRTTYTKEPDGRVRLTNSESADGANYKSFFEALFTR